MSPECPARSGTPPGVWPRHRSPAGCSPRCRTRERHRPCPALARGQEDRHPPAGGPLSRKGCEQAVAIVSSAPICWQLGTTASIAELDRNVAFVLIRNVPFFVECSRARSLDELTATCPFCLLPRAAQALLPQLSA